MSAPLTPAERALARVLVAWDDLPNDQPEPDREVMTALLAVSRAVEGFTRADQTLNARGRALVGRLRDEEARGGGPALTSAEWADVRVCVHHALLRGLGYGHVSGEALDKAGAARQALLAKIPERP